MLCKRVTGDNKGLLCQACVTSTGREDGVAIVDFLVGADEPDQTLKKRGEMLVSLVATASEGVAKGTYSELLGGHNEYSCVRSMRDG
jgi:hypothetical protein